MLNNSVKVLEAKVLEAKVLDNLSLVWSVIHSLKIDFREHDDCYSAGCLALVQAAKNFDPSREVKFSTYAWYCVRGQILNYLSSFREVNFEGDVIDPWVNDVEDRIFLEEILGRLTLDERYFVELRLSGLGFKEMGMLFNISRQRAHQKWHSILSHLTLFAQNHT